MKHSFILRIYNNEVRTVLGDIQHITISGIPIISKMEKYGDVCLHLSAQKKHKHKVIVSNKRLYFGAGSHSYPIIAFKGTYLDIRVEDFPRYPAFYCDKYACKNIMNGYNLNCNDLLPIWTQYRKIEIIPL